MHAADKYELESARIAGDSCIVASGKQLSSGCAVVLKFYVDEEDFLHLKRFHHQARDPQFIPGASVYMLHCAPACITSAGLLPFGMQALVRHPASLAVEQPVTSE